MDDYPTAAQYHAYLESYAIHFSLRRHIRLAHRVISVSADQGRWRLEVLHGSEKMVVLADKVFVATGPHTKANRPVFEGEDRFKGQIVHAQAYKE